VDLIRLIDNLGRAVWEERKPNISGNTIKVDAAGITKGVYILEVQYQNNVTDRNKIVIQPVGN